MRNEMYNLQKRRYDAFGCPKSQNFSESSYRDLIISDRETSKKIRLRNETNKTQNPP